METSTEAGAAGRAPKPPPARFAAAIFAVGMAGVVVTVAGPIAVMAYYGFTPYTNIVYAILTDTSVAITATGMSMGLAAILVGFGSYRRMSTRRGRERAISGAVLGIQALAVGAFFLWFRSGNADRFAFNFLNFERLHGYWPAFRHGIRNTLVLALGGEAGGIVLGLILAVLVISKRRVVRAPARVYINFFRGTPLIWQLSAGYFLLLFVVGRISTFLVAGIIFAANTGAYAAEVFRAGIQSIERGQMEAARSLGMSYLQAMSHAIVPQAFRRVIPPLMNEFVILIKDTALIIVLGLAAAQYEIYTAAREGYSDTFSATFFVAAAAAYLVVTLPLIGLVNAVERRLRSGLVGIAG